MLSFVLSASNKANFPAVPATLGFLPRPSGLRPFRG